ncbi:MAG: hypothetical protein QGG40_15245, partial [Myxococcota bacterium]|nr:hypothetical protein [Myxococcota bacterium]
DDPFFRRLGSLSNRRPDEELRLELSDQATGGRVRTEGLRDKGIRWIVLHRTLDPDASTRIERAITTQLGPGVTIGDALRWDLGVSPNETPAGHLPNQGRQDDNVERPHPATYR